MEFPLHIDSVRMGLSIVYSHIKGSQVEFFKS